MVGLLVTKIASEEAGQEREELVSKNANFYRQRLSPVLEVSHSNLCPHGVNNSAARVEDRVTCLICDPNGEDAEMEENANASQEFKSPGKSIKTKKCLIETKTKGHKKERYSVSAGPSGNQNEGNEVGIASNFISGSADASSKQEAQRGRPVRSSAPARSINLSKSASEPDIPSGDMSRPPKDEGHFFKSYSTETYPSRDVIGFDLRRTQSLKALSQTPEELLSRSDRRLLEAFKCPRVASRRNALNNPFKMSMPQEMRERIQRENKERKTSVRRRVSSYFRSLVEEEPEIDLI